MGDVSPKKLREQIIEPVLEGLDPDVPYSVQAMELLLGTAAAESHFKYTQQLGGGPARGLWQMEPATERDHKEWLKNHPELQQKVLGWKPNDLKTNQSYACAMARIHYWRVPVKLPAAGDVEGQARYWKRWYNTYLGAGTPEHYIEAWKNLVEGKL